MTQFLHCGVCNTLAKYLGVALDPSVSVHGSRHKVNLEVYGMQCPHKHSCSTEGPSAGTAEGEPLSGHPQVTAPVSLPPAWQAPSALPEPMAIKGAEMEELGGGPGCSSSLNGIFPSAHSGQACQEVGMGGWMEESSPSSSERVQEAGAHRAPLHLPLLPSGAHLDHGPGCWGSASPPMKGLEG